MGDTQDRRSSLAAAVWITTGAYCAALAATAMLASAVVQLVSDFDAGIAIWSIVFIAIAAVVGWVAGAILGVPLGLIVTLAHGRLRTRAVTFLLTLLPLLTAAVVLYGLLGIRSNIGNGIAAFLTLLGGILIAGRYERLARERPVH